MEAKDWEVINKKMGVDILDIVVNLDNRYTTGQQADLIAKRCDLTAKAGYYQALKDHEWDDSYYKAKQLGRKEVMEWINDNYPIGTPKWIGRCKEWGYTEK